MPQVELLDTPTDMALPIVASRIAGKAVQDPGAPSSPVFDPATGEAIRFVSHASNATVDLAVEAASTALASWRNVPQNRRFALLLALRELINAHRAEFVDLIVGEGGKAKPDAEGEFNRAIDGLDSCPFNAGLAPGRVRRAGCHWNRHLFAAAPGRHCRRQSRHSISR